MHTDGTHATHASESGFRWAELWLVLIGILASIWFFYPGCVSGDTRFSWLEAQDSPEPHFLNWHPPMVAFASWLLQRLPFHLNPPHAGLFVLMNALYWTGLVLALRPWRHRKALWLAFFLAAGFFPPNFAITSQTIKDSLMCAALLAAYGCLLAAQRQNSKMALGGGLCCLYLSLAFRHNAAVAVLPFALWAGFILLQSRTAAHREKIIAGIAILAALLGAAAATNRILTSHDVHIEQSLFAFDLTGISALTHHIYLPDLYNDYDKSSPLNKWWTIPGSTIHQTPLTLENIQRLYLPYTNQPIYWDGPGKGLRLLDTPEEVATLQKAWLHAILHEPAAYLKVRTDLYLSLLGKNNNDPYFCMPPHDYDSQYSHMELPRFYVEYRDTWMFRPLAYLLTILALLGLGLWKKQWMRVDLWVLGMSGLLYSLSLFFIVQDYNGRYLYWQMLAAILMAINVAFIAAPSLLHTWRHRHAAPQLSEDA